MKRPLTLAAVQLPSELPAKSNATRQRANFDTAGHYLKEAGQRGADIACLGEIFNAVGINLTKRNARALVRHSEEEALRRFAPIAKKHRMAIIAPILTVRENLVRNIALFIGPNGKPLGAYTKVHCIENEKDFGVIPGDDWPVFKIKGANVGVQICHDNSFPESARCLTLNGADIIFWPHLMSGWGGEFMDILMRAPSIHNGVHHVPVSYGCPPDRSWMPGMMLGRSSIIGPDATILADAGRYPGMALTTIDLAAPRIAEQFTRPGSWVWKPDMLNDRRPDTYTPFTQPVVKQKTTRAGSSSQY